MPDHPRRIPANPGRATVWWRVAPGWTPLNERPNAAWFPAARLDALWTGPWPALFTAWVVLALRNGLP